MQILHWSYVREALKNFSTTPEPKQSLKKKVKVKKVK